MRVIAGKYRSRPLRSLRGMDIRPTSDRLRETLFNVLTAGNPAALEGSVWLDLVCRDGSGRNRSPEPRSEAGLFVESSAAAADVIRENLQSLGIDERIRTRSWRIAAAPSGAWSGSMWPPTSSLSIRPIV